jgi:RsiW-degrading membrane proteinase PrsW (M82 family)
VGGHNPLWFTRRGEPRLARPVVLVLVLAAILGVVARRWADRHQTPEEQAMALWGAHRYAAAEAKYAELLHQKPTVPIAMSLVAVHEEGIALHTIEPYLDAAQRNRLAGDHQNEVMPEEAFAAIVNDPGLPEDVSRIARYEYARRRKSGELDALRTAIVAAADATPPAPWANHVLAEEAALAFKNDEAAQRYEREARFFAERRADMDSALMLWMQAEAWDYVEGKLADPEVSARVSPRTHYRYAVHARDWKGAALWIFAEWNPLRDKPTLVLAVLTAFVWGLFLARLGKVAERPAFRVPIYLLAFVLGVASVAPTIALIGIEEASIKLVESGDTVRDFLFFTFGVGLREEASKLLMFLPLLPILRAGKAAKIDVVVCGAFVGLGFAAEENIDYFAHGDLTEAMGRFLTANFLHVSMTSTLATALYEFLEDTEKHAVSFSSTAAFVIGLHGAYDFLISHHEFQGGYLAMALFFFLARRFLDTADAARGRADRGPTLLQFFVVGLAVVTGLSFIFACTRVEYREAALVLTEGVLGELVIAYVFVRTLRAM